MEECSAGATISKPPLLKARANARLTGPKFLPLAEGRYDSITKMLSRDEKSEIVSPERTSPGAGSVSSKGDEARS